MSKRYQQNHSRIEREPVSARQLDTMLWEAKRIMENDEVFSRNLNDLRKRILARKVEDSMWSKVRSALVGECFRRNNVPLTEARMMLRHGA